MPVHHPAQRGDLRRVLVRIVRGRPPPHPDQRPVQVPDRAAAGGAQQQVPVFVLAARRVLGDQAQPLRVEQRGTPDQERGRVQHRHPRPDEFVEGDPLQAGEAGYQAVPVPDLDRTGDQVGVRFQDGDLGAEPVRRPLVVVIAERDQVGVQREDAGVAGTGEAGGALVGQHGHPGQGRVRLGLVVDHDGRHAPGVVLRGDRGQGAAQQAGPVARGYHDADRWVHPVIAFRIHTR